SVCLLKVYCKRSGELISEFTGKNTGYRVLADGKIENSNQGMGKILGMTAFIMSTAISTMANGTFMREVNSLITTIDGSAVMMKGNAVSWQSEKGGVTRAASIPTMQSEKLMRLNKVIGMHEYETDEMGNWKGKIWEWK
ncbi:hypothetical protein MUP77_07985, partial [Candidatus Bathyarchaeota archaeon]|nr:hypothetical protein [Candidatus Bathyarchaeota archaeon]